MAYLPGWDPVPHGYDHVTLDLSTRPRPVRMPSSWPRSSARGCTTSTSPTALAARATSTSSRGWGTNPCGELLESLAGSGFTGLVTVEVSTRKSGETERVDASPSRWPSPGSTWRPSSARAGSDVQRPGATR